MRLMYSNRAVGESNYPTDCSIKVYQSFLFCMNLNKPICDPFLSIYRIQSHSKVQKLVRPSVAKHVKNRGKP